MAELRQDCLVGNYSYISFNTADLEESTNLNDKIEDVCKALYAVWMTTKWGDQVGQLINKSVIVWGIVSHKFQDLWHQE